MRRADDEPDAYSGRRRHQYSSPFAAPNTFLHLVATLVPVFRRLIGDLASHISNAGLDVFGCIFHIAYRRLGRGLRTPVRPTVISCLMSHFSCYSYERFLCALCANVLRVCFT